jgi:5-methylcytosine-specific restriction protein A
MLPLPSGLVLQPGDRIGRREKLHVELGGQEQGGISTPVAYPVVLAFTGSTGRPFGYEDGWEDDGIAFRYFGEGQRGPMVWKRGNPAVRDHSLNGKELHLFKADGDGWAEYVDEMICGAWEYRDSVPDADGEPRRAIVFRLTRVAASIDPNPTARLPQRRTGLWTLPLDELRRRAMSGPEQSGDAKVAKRNVYARSVDVATYVRRRADGVCEGCRAAAPFLALDGHPYLEPHHTTRLSDGGPDSPAHVVAVCPNCHRKAHYGKDGERYNMELRATARGLESLASRNQP